MPVMRLGRKSVWHVIHETQSNVARRICYVICRPDEVLTGEIRSSVPTCAKCLQLDNPTALSDEGKRALIQRGMLTQGAHRLRRIDYIDAGDDLTRRGRLVARDFVEEPAPWPDKHGVAHRRLPLSATARCGTEPIVFPDPLTTERYGSLREISPAVTCLFCTRIT